MLISICILGVILLVLVCSAYSKMGFRGIKEGVKETGSFFINVLPLLLLGFAIAGFFQVVVPQSVVANLLGRGAGIKAYILGGIGGAIIPGGPYFHFPFIAGLLKSGASVGSACAYITGWGLIAAQRVITWELPFLGYQVVIVRLIGSILVPIIVGIICQLLYDLLFL